MAVQVNRRIEVQRPALAQHAPDLGEAVGVRRRLRTVGKRLFPMLERLIAEDYVERAVGERDIAGMTVATGAKLRRAAAVDERLDAGPRTAGELDDSLTVRAAGVADLEHAQAASGAQMRFGGGDHALAERAAERHPAGLPGGVELRAAAARDDPLAAALLPIRRGPFVAGEAAPRR